MYVAPRTRIITEDDKIVRPEQLRVARRLIRAETPAEAQPLEGMPGLLKLLEQGRLDDAARETAAFAALCQRRGDPLPSAAGKLLLLALQEREGENSPC